MTGRKIELPDIAVIYAFRYCLGRMSCAVSDGVEIVRAAWPKLDANLRNVIERDLREAKKRDDDARADGRVSEFMPLGMTCDRDSWLWLLDWIEKQKKEEAKR